MAYGDIPSPEKRSILNLVESQISNHLLSRLSLSNSDPCVLYLTRFPLKPEIPNNTPEPLTLTLVMPLTANLILIMR